MPAEDADGVDGPQLAAPVAEGAMVVLADQLERRPQKESFLWRVWDLHALTRIRHLVLCSCVSRHILWSLCLSNRLLFLTCSSSGGCANCRCAESRLGNTKGASAQISQMINAGIAEAINRRKWTPGVSGTLNSTKRRSTPPKKSVCHRTAAAAQAATRTSELSQTS